MPHVELPDWLFLGGPTANQRLPSRLPRIFESSFRQKIEFLTELEIVKFLRDIAMFILNFVSNLSIFTRKIAIFKIIDFSEFSDFSDFFYGKPQCYKGEFSQYFQFL